MSESINTKTARVLNHLKEHGSITSWEAIEKFGATRLSAIIFTLRKKHVIISSRLEGVDRYGNISRFVRYIYAGEREEDEKQDETNNDT